MLAEFDVPQDSAPVLLHLWTRADFPGTFASGTSFPGAIAIDDNEKIYLMMTNQVSSQTFQVYQASANFALSYLGGSGLAMPDNTHTPQQIAIKGNFAYLAFYSATSTGSLAAVDISSTPTLRGGLNVAALPSYINWMYVDEGMLRVTFENNGSNAYRNIDITDPDNFKIINSASASFPSEPRGIGCRNNFCFVASWFHVVYGIDNTTPTIPIVTSQLTVTNSFKAAILLNNLFIAGGDYTGGDVTNDSLVFFDATNPYSITRLSTTWNKACTVKELLSDGAKVYVSCYEAANSLVVVVMNALNTAALAAGSATIGSAHIQNDLDVDGSARFGTGARVGFQGLASLGPISGSTAQVSAVGIGTLANYPIDISGSNMVIGAGQLSRMENSITTLASINATGVHFNHYSMVTSNDTTDNSGSAAHFGGFVGRSSDTANGKTIQIGLEGRADARSEYVGPNTPQAVGTYGYVPASLSSGKPSNLFYMGLRGKACLTDAGDCAGSAQSTGSVTGLYIDDTIGGAIPYGIYQQGTNDKNYFGGQIGIGNLNPTAPLDIAQYSASAVAVARFFSNASGSPGVLQIGRTALETAWGTIAGADQFITGAVAGDFFIRNQNATSMWFSNDSSGATNAMHITANNQTALRIMTKAALATTTPDAVGVMATCSDCTRAYAVVIATAATKGSWRELGLSTGAN